MKTLVDNHISGAPVVDESDNLVGVITEFPLMEIIYEPKLKNSRVSELMTKDVITVNEDTLLSDVASIFILHRVRRVPVVRDNHVVGVISRHDVASRPSWLHLDSVSELRAEHGRY